MHPVAIASAAPPKVLCTEQVSTGSDSGILGQPPGVAAGITPFNPPVGAGRVWTKQPRGARLPFGPCSPGSAGPGTPA